jgi:hypothetical protein
VKAQTEIPGGISQDASGRPISSSRTQGSDSLQQRDSNEDSITIYFRNFDSSRTYRIDSTVDDLYTAFPDARTEHLPEQPWFTHRSLIFLPFLKPGFDPGFHGYDTYKFTVENTRIFQTTRPYTELDYLLGSKSEQTIKDPSHTKYQSILERVI